MSVGEQQVGGTSSRPDRNNRSRLGWLFALIAAGFALAALFHLAALAFPAIAEPSPAWRHGAFVLVNGAIALLLVRRPPWFALLFALLTVQQLFSHGRAGWNAWSSHGRLDWQSIVVLVAVPMVAALLLRDAWPALRGWTSRSRSASDSNSQGPLAGRRGR